LSVLYIGLPAGAGHWLQIGYQDFAASLGDQLPHRVYDFERSPEEQFEGIEMVVEAGGSFATPAMIDTAARNGIRFWQIVGTGIDHVDVARFHDRGIQLANLPGLFSSVALAEHAFFGMLFFARLYRNTQRALQLRILCDPVGEELSGKNLSIIGFGASGRELARRASAFGMRILAMDLERPAPETLEGLTCSFAGGMDDLDFLLEEGDYVSLHVPLNSSTRHLIDGEGLSRMKSTAVFINVARSEVVEEEALVEALQRGAIRGAVLDVFAQEPVDPGHPLLRMENVLATPHTAGVTSGTSRRRAAAAVENILRVHNGREPLYVVNGLRSMTAAGQGSDGAR
jgi:phosphoglycerate dehydrogenase-like enzyme